MGWPPRPAADDYGVPIGAVAGDEDRSLGGAVDVEQLAWAKGQHAAGGCQTQLLPFYYELAQQSDAAVIVNISSVCGTRALGNSIPYAVSKAGLTRLLATQLGPLIRVNAIAPGLIDTPWYD
ncbi:SDR family oxidoreductase [Streptomyces sp. NPDC001393]